MHLPSPRRAASSAPSELKALQSCFEKARQKGDCQPLWDFVRLYLRSNGRQKTTDAADNSAFEKLSPADTDAPGRATQEQDEVIAALKLHLCSPPPCLDARGLWHLLRVARLSATPGANLAQLLTLSFACPRPIWHWPSAGRLAVAATLCGSAAAARILLAEPALAERLFADEDIEARQMPHALRDSLRQARAVNHETAEFERRVRRVRSQTWVRIVARALAGFSDVDTTLHELSDLADAVVDALLRHYLRRERTRNGFFAQPTHASCGFAVLAQGKLGGQELNLSSDIDLQFIYAPPAATDITSSQLQARYSAVAQRLVRGLTHSDAAGLGYRVDLDLRPEGKKGVLINAIGAMELYYARWGAAWERLALIRARHIGGATWVSRALLVALQTFIYPRHVAHSTLYEVGQVAGRIAQERRRSALTAGRSPGIDIKRDRGGIRDVELFVQTKQHLHGGRMPSLQTPSLFEALVQLEILGIFKPETVHLLRRAYRFLRAVENCLQATEQRQTHRLPESAAGLAQLAAQMRWRHSITHLRRMIARQRRVVHRLTHRLFAVPQSGFSQVHRRMQRAMDVLLATGQTQRAGLLALGFSDGAWAQGVLSVLAQGQGGPFCPSPANQFETLGATLLLHMAKSPDPDQALRLYCDLESVLRRAPGYFVLLQKAPALQHRLVNLLGTSVFLSRTLVQFPDLVDWLAQSAQLAAQRLPSDANAYAERLQAALQLCARGDQAQLDGVCRFKLREQLRLGIMDKAQALSPAQLSWHLSALAQVCVSATLHLSVAAWLQTHPLKRRCDVEDNFVVIALGRLGSMEMGYGSDVDLVFVWQQPPASCAQLQAHEFFSAADALRLAQGCLVRLVAKNLPGALYAIDTRLRPSGNQGPLVTAAQSFIAYYAERAMLWECQALLRARPVAGNLSLGDAVLRACAQSRYPPKLAASAFGELHRMRLRMDHAAQRRRRQSATCSPDRLGQIDIKVGQGGLADLEFAVQALQLKYADAYKSLRCGHTAQALAALGALGLLSAQRTQRSLEAYWYLRRLEGALRIVDDRPLSTLDLRQPYAKALARRLGYAHRTQPLKALERDWQRHAARAQKLYAHVFAAAIRPPPASCGTQPQSSGNVQQN